MTYFAKMENKHCLVRCNEYKVKNNLCSCESKCSNIYYLQSKLNEVIFQLKSKNITDNERLEMIKYKVELEHSLREMSNYLM